MENIKKYMAYSLFVMFICTILPLQTFASTEDETVITNDLNIAASENPTDASITEDLTNEIDKTISTEIIKETSNVDSVATETNVEDCTKPVEQSTPTCAIDQNKIMQLNQKIQSIMSKLQELKAKTQTIQSSKLKIKLEKRIKYLELKLKLALLKFMRKNNIPASNMPMNFTQGNIPPNMDIEKMTPKIDNEQMKHFMNMSDLMKNKRIIEIIWGNVDKLNIASGSMLDFSGKIDVKEGDMKLLFPIGFEDNTDKVESKVNPFIWKSSARPAIDGLVFEVTASSGSNVVKFNLTVGPKINDQLIEIKFLPTDKPNNDSIYSFDVSDGLKVVVKKKPWVPGKGIPGESFINDIKSRIDPKFMDDAVSMFGNIEKDKAEKMQKIMFNNDEFANKFLKFRSDNNFQKNLDNIIQFGQFVPDTISDDFTKMLNFKVQMLDKITSIQDMFKNLSNETTFKDFISNIKDFNFTENCGKKIGQKIDELINKNNNISEEQLKEEIKKIKEEAQSQQKICIEEKFKSGIIPFKDTDDNQWFAGFVSSMKSKNIISGYKDDKGNALGEFRPANNVTIAEAIKMILKSADIKTDNEGNPWYKVYTDKAKSLNISLFQTDIDPNKQATRGNVIHMILEVYGILPSDVKTSSFSDVPTTHKDFVYIEKAKELGIISGDTDKDGKPLNTFRPDAPINRAEVSKMLKFVMDLKNSSVQ